MRTASEAIAWGTAQVTHPTQSWKGLCQSFVRSCDGVAGWAPSAYDAWLKIPDAHKHAGGHPADAPAGAAIYFKRNHVGQERPGHVVLATAKNCLSNDIYREGHIDFAPRDIFIAHWNMAYLGWSLWTPFGEVKQ